MMSRCTVCGTGTDMALIDVLTREQIQQVGGTDKVPLIGTCGDEKCVTKQVHQNRSNR